MRRTNLSHYFRRLRMIYCREQQLIGLLPDLVPEVIRPRLREAMAGYLAAALCRRHMIRDLARDHRISPRGDECLAMRKLIAVGIARLDLEGLGEPHDLAVEAFCHQVHDAVMVDYKLTRDVAVEQSHLADIGCFDEVIEAMMDAFPEPQGKASTAPEPPPLSAMHSGGRALGGRHDTLLVSSPGMVPQAS